jgi:hypothetical protein
VGGVEKRTPLARREVEWKVLIEVALHKVWVYRRCRHIEDLDGLMRVAVNILTWQGC